MNTLSLIKNLDKEIADYLVAQNVAQDSKNWVDTSNKNASKKEEKSGKDEKVDSTARKSFERIEAGGIKNLNAKTCWMNTLLQHLRFTNDFETIHTGEIDDEKLRPNEKRKDFEKLQ